MGAVAADRIFPPDLTRLHTLSLEVQDRNGTALDVLPTRDGFLRLPASAADVSPNFLALLLRAEDRRFWYDPGIDPLAMLRAAGQLVRYGHVVSGGSTLTMQVARLLVPHRHNLRGKFYDMARAVQLTAHYSKPQILAMYLTLAPYGGNIEGVRAASLAYFQKPPASLTEAQAALLVVLPRSPERLRPDRHQAAALRAVARVLAQNAQGPAGDLAPLVRHAMPALAPHLAWRLYGAGARGIMRTTLDAGLQQDATGVLTRALPWMPARESIAALIVNNRSRTVLAYIGGTDGDVDMVRALRSPGSALKPFLYGMALDDSLIVPGTMMQDVPASTGGYAPHDFEGDFHGMVTAAVALQQSLNLPAVQLLRAEGPQHFVAALRATGVRLVLPGNTRAGLPVILGGLGISLNDLTMLYTGLADGGGAAPLRLLPDEPVAAQVPEMSPVAAAQIGAMLRGAALPAGVATDDAHDIAYKTGTSYGFRDAWAAGFSGDYTIVVWTGRVDGTPVPGAYGRITAAPLMFHLFSLLPPDRHTAPAPPPAQALAGLSPSLQVFGARAAMVSAPNSPRILFPPSGAVLQVTQSDGIAPISLEAVGGVPPYRWVINGTMLPAAPIGMSMIWQPAGQGFAHISLLDARDATVTEDVELH
jgi:penicillin-binding protein 1C